MKYCLRVLSVLAFVLLHFSMSAQSDFAKNIYEDHSKFIESSLKVRRIKHKDVMPLVDQLTEDKRYEVQTLGKSVEGRDIKLVSVGKGDINIFLWSQMHGDEPTATMAIFDMINFLNAEGYEKEKKLILSKLKLHFIPMLNPDGAEKYERRNALGIDINRDALRLQSPESQILKRIRDSLNADFGFNLHDQSRYYNTKYSPNTATVSFLATAYNYEKEINDVRTKAMQVIIQMNRELQGFLPGHVGRYSDEFEPRAFGDNIAKWGTSLILIESGGLVDDPEKQEIRRLNFVAMLSALKAIATAPTKEDISAYSQIPRNDRKMLDLKIANLTYPLLGELYNRSWHLS